MLKTELPICFIDPFYNLNKRSAASGTSHYLLSAFLKYWGSTEAVGPLPVKIPFSSRLRAKVWTSFIKGRYLIRWDETYCRKLAVAIDSVLADLRYELLFTTYPNPIPYLKTKMPIVLWSDCTFVSARRIGYPGVTPAGDVSINLATSIEQHALQRTDLIIYSNWWAADSAINDYGIDPDKIAVVPLGANLDVVPDADSLQPHLSAKSDVLKLLFIGMDWERKGGQIALETFFELVRLGVSVELTLVGSKPPSDNLASYHQIHVFDRLNKDDPSDMVQLDALYRNSHFLLLPTRAECCAVVYNEASAYALPIITTNVGGVRTAVREGVNGRLLSLEATSTEFASAIAEIWQNPAEYIRLSRSARKLYEEELNYERCTHDIAEAWWRVREGKPAMSAEQFEERITAFVPRRSSHTL